MDGEPQRYVDLEFDNNPHPLAGECSDRYEEEGGCGLLCSQHHNNVNRIAEDLYDQCWESNHIVVSWSNSACATFCKENHNDAHVKLNSYGITTGNHINGDWVPDPIIQMLDINATTSTDTMKLMCVVLAHELAHTLGLDEVNIEDTYDYSKIHEEDGRACIMVRSITSKLESIYALGKFALCDDCRRTIHTEIPDDPYAN